MEAAHIKPWSIVKEHKLDNGLLLRADWHFLFDLGHWTLVPDAESGVFKILLGKEMLQQREYQEYNNKVVGEWFPYLARNIYKTIDCNNFEVQKKKFDTMQRE